MSAQASDSETREYQFGGDYVLAADVSAGSWVSATYLVDLTEAR